ncbi:hypothetical protein MLD52_18850 [Puniceicoccaceae bacterium K14]|nr:hypothetical protein [Puniceicoccaceae bacterium K14]
MEKISKIGIQAIRSFLVFSVYLSLIGALPSASEAAVKPWGIYEMLTRRSDWSQSIDRETAQLKGQPQFILFFRDMAEHRSFPHGPVAIAQEKSLTPVISLELTTWGRGRRDNFLPAIINGDFDSFFFKWANDAKQYESDIYLRFGFEMNGDWFTWGAQPERFKKAWIHVHKLFEKIGCSNVKWMFSPNVIWGDITVSDGLAAYYPGDEYVDSIGIDGYNFGDHHDQWHKWQSYSEVFERTIEACTAAQKPIYLSEIGCADGPRKAAWIEDFLKCVSDDERVSGFIYFNHYNPRKSEPNWRLDSDPKTLKIFQDWASRNN